MKTGILLALLETALLSAGGTRAAGHPPTTAPETVATRPSAPSFEEDVARLRNIEKPRLGPTTEWVLGGRFVQTRTTNRPANADGLFLLTYDPQRKAYRGWWADDQGNTSEWTGHWDETAQTLSLTFDAKDGFRATSTVRFVGPDNAEWQLTVTATDGKVMLEMDGKIARKK